MRKSGRFGGVSIFVRKDFSDFNLIHKLDIDQNNSLLINLQKFNIKIGAIYRQRESNFENFLSRLEHILDNQNNCYVFGDFNLDLFNLDTDNIVQQYHDRVLSNGFIFLNSLSKSMPTRVDNRRKTSTCIDHIITDAPCHDNRISYSLFLDDLFGDHKALLLSVCNKKIIANTTPKYLTIQKINHERIIAENLFSEISTESFAIFQSDLKSLIDANTITYTKRDRFKKPFMTKEILDFITIKHNYFRLKKKYPRSELVANRFTYYRNIVNKKVVNARKKYNEKIFSDSMDDQSATWCHINNFLRNTDKKVRSSITSIKINNHPVANKHQIVENFNSYFTTIAESIHDTITIDQNIFDTLHDFEYYPITVPFECQPTSADEVIFILSNLSNSNAKDINGASNNLFKKYRLVLCDPLVTLINNCLETSEFPDCLKIAKVKPLFKSGNKYVELPSNSHHPD